jgi:hypothetical protein
MRKSILVKIGGSIVSLSLITLGITIPSTNWIDENKAAYISIITIIALIIGALLWIFGIRIEKNEIKNSINYRISKWEHFDKMVNLILSIEQSQVIDRPKIMADIQRELTQIGDSGLDEEMRPFQEVMLKEEEYNMKPSRYANDLILPKIRQYMNRKYKR